MVKPALPVALHVLDETDEGRPHTKSEFVTEQGNGMRCREGVSTVGKPRSVY